MGRTTVTAASVALPVDATIVNDFAWAAAESVFNDGSVKLFNTHAATDADATPYASYEFVHPVIESVIFSGVNATVEFATNDYQVTVGSSTSAPLPLH